MKIDLFSSQLTQLYSCEQKKKYLKGRVTEKDFICWITTQMLITASGAEPGWSQELKTASGSLLWVADTQQLEPSASFLSTLTRSRIWRLRSWDLSQQSNVGCRFSKQCLNLLRCDALPLHFLKITRCFGIRQKYLMCAYHFVRQYYKYKLLSIENKVNFYCFKDIIKWNTTL